MKATVVIRRIGGGLLVMWLVSLLTFALIQLLPGDAAQAIAGETATQADVDRIRQELGFDRPLVEQYSGWFGNVLTGDFGNSLYTGRPVIDLIVEAAPATLSLTAMAIVIAVLIGVTAGLVAAVRQGGWIDRLVTSAATVGIAMPSFWVLMLLLLPFAVLNRWLPATGYVPLSDGLWPWLSHILLPATALGLASAAELARHTRGCAADVLARPYVRTARARGAAGGWLIRRHVLRNSAIPVITVLGLHVGRLLGGSIVIESVAGISGLGTLAIQAILQRDYTTIQGYVLFSAVIVVVVNLLVDLLYGWINPKVRA
ncbi:ABC transporter permease [Solwaraspora sp. WMMD1047]|uniref:ABC transporter permease n=1 Tax=Solwaraspora sp. WMMD1047 TaxID=3016102 RepID=UPI002416087A|nr:ABC transporter permease [Solwaraspora sp. WMMD1047]MDG4830399.1 ABC transporter permease [Solwaraspora sp. WMMD1047]